MFIHIVPLKRNIPQNDGHWSSFASSWTPKPLNGPKIVWGNFCFLYQGYGERFQLILYIY